MLDLTKLRALAAGWLRDVTEKEEQARRDEQSDDALVRRSASHRSVSASTRHSDATDLTALLDELEKDG